MSGLQIFNAHPALYWGDSSYSGRPPLLEIDARDSGNGEVIGVTRVFGHEFDTTGVLGLSTTADGQTKPHAFPAWATIPGFYSLALARDWHFFFAWILVLNGAAYVAVLALQPALAARPGTDPSGTAMASARRLSIT